jgi:hypothetical protein
MDDELISKKDLLEITGISYGQLYRWKRKNLIPEDWFVRKASFTGQETFFPKDKILTRVDKILGLKEDKSLDDLADMLSSNPSEIIMGQAEIVQRNIVTMDVYDMIKDELSSSETHPFVTILCVFIFGKLLDSGSVNIDEGKIAFRTLMSNYTNISLKTFDLVFVRKTGFASCLLIQSNSSFYFEPSVKILIKMSISGCIEELKMKIMNGGNENE